MRQPNFVAFLTDDAELILAAETWRADLGTRWQSEFLPKANGTATHPEKK